MGTGVGTGGTGTVTVTRHKVRRKIEWKRTDIVGVDQRRPARRDGRVAVDAKRAPVHAPSFLQLGPVLGRLQRGRNVVATRVVVETVEAHHADEPHGARAAHGGAREEEPAGLICCEKGPCLGMADGDKVFAVALQPVSISKRPATVALSNEEITDLHLVILEVLPCSAVKSIVEARVLAVHLRGHGPDSILQAHRGPQVRRRVERLEVPRRVHDGNERMLVLEVGLVSTRSAG